MLLSRTPLRISFFGGGTDYPDWYRENGGLVLSTTINKYSYITARYLPPFFDYKYRVRYFKQEFATSIDEIEHPTVRESLRLLDIDQGVEIVHTADLPARSGLGSSSTFTVGLLHSLYSLKNYMPTKRELATKAIHVEQNCINECVGSQDQTAAAFGGLNIIRFGGTNNLEVNSVVLSPERLDLLQSRLLLCFTGYARTASEIAQDQVDAIPKIRRDLHEIQSIAEQGISVLTSSSDLDDFGRLLGQQWLIKRTLSASVTNPDIDAIYESAIKAGALGGKLLGAGGGGFMLFYVPDEHLDSVKAALQPKLIVPFCFDFTGSQLIYYTH